MLRLNIIHPKDSNNGCLDLQQFQYFPNKQLPKSFFGEHHEVYDEEVISYLTSDKKNLKFAKCELNRLNTLCNNLAQNTQFKVRWT